MANRTGTYVAFDGLSKTNPAESDYKYYSAIQAWASGKDFKITNSHEKTDAVRDSSKKATLEARIRERLSASKQCLIIISKDTRKTGSMLSYEIEKAVDLYGIPLIIAYIGFEKILNPKTHSSKWPLSLETRLNNGTARAIHIPFRKKAINKALEDFHLNNMPKGSFTHYLEHVQDTWSSTYSL